MARLRELQLGDVGEGPRRAAFLLVLAWALALRLPFLLEAPLGWREWLGVLPALLIAIGLYRWCHPQLGFGAAVFAGLLAGAATPLLPQSPFSDLWLALGFGIGAAKTWSFAMRRRREGAFLLGMASGILAPWSAATALWLPVTILWLPFVSKSFRGWGGLATLALLLAGWLLAAAGAGAALHFQGMELPLLVEGKALLDNFGWPGWDALRQQHSVDMPARGLVGGLDLRPLFVIGALGFAGLLPSVRRYGALFLAVMLPGLLGAGLEASGLTEAALRSRILATPGWALFGGYGLFRAWEGRSNWVSWPLIVLVLLVAWLWSAA